MAGGNRALLHHIYFDRLTAAGFHDRTQHSTFGRINKRNQLAYKKRCNCALHVTYCSDASSKFVHVYEERNDCGLSKVVAGEERERGVKRDSQK